MRQSDPTKESGIALGPHQDGTISMRYGDYLDLVAERDALREALTKADKQLGAAPVLDAYSAGAWQTIRAALESTP